MTGLVLILQMTGFVLLLYMTGPVLIPITEPVLQMTGLGLLFITDDWVRLHIRDK